MAVSVVQAQIITQAGGSWSGSFASSVTAGNSVILLATGANSTTAMSSSAPTFAGSSVAGATQLWSQNEGASSVAYSTAWLLPNVAGGSAAVGLTLTNGSNFGSGATGLWALEVSGLGASPTVATPASAGGSSAAFSSGATGSASRAGIGVGCVVAFGQVVSQPTGWTDLTQMGDAFGAAGYQLVSSGTVTFAGTLTTGNWAVGAAIVLTTSGGGATVSGAVATSALAAPAGSVSAGETVAGPVATSALAAPAGSVTVGAGAVGPAAATTLAAPAGSVHASETVAGPVAASALAAPAGAVVIGVGPAGPVATSALAAPAGTVRASSAVAGPVAALGLAAPAGSVSGAQEAFPEIALGLGAELEVNGTWTDVTPWMDHGPVIIERGHPDESTTVSPSTLEMTLTNTTGEFTSQNPVSSLYPWLKPNVPLRVSIPAASTYLRSEVDDVSGATCPDASGLHITGDIDIRLDLQLTDYGDHDLMFKWASGNQGWFLELSGGALVFFWSTTGSDVLSAASTAPLPFGRLTLRVTLAVSTGTVTFWTGPAGNADSSSGWTQLGAATVSGATSVFASTGGIGIAGWYGSVYEAEIRNGIGGTVVAHPVFSAQTAGATSFSDAQGNPWTLTGTAELSGRDYRGHFEVPEFPQEEPPYDPDTASAAPDVLCAISGGGLLRRYGQANTPLLSPMRRAYTKLSSTATAAAPVAYWPMEDAAGASQLASGLGGTPMYFSGSPTLASSSSFACSAPLPVTNGASFSGRVPPSASWTANVTRFLMEVPSGGEANGAVIANVYSTGTVALLQLSYDTGGAFTLTGFSSAGAQLFTTGPQAFAVNGAPLRVSMELQPSGSSVSYAIAVLAPGGAGAPEVTGTLASASVGAVTQVALNPGGALTGTAFGHCSVQAAWDTLFDLAGALDAWLGEPAGTRFQRLCAEEGIQFRGRGQLAATTLMGTQTIETLTQLCQECADADRGVWYELRQQLGWGYVTRQALYNQAAALTLDHDQDHLSPWTSDPTQDDQTLLNDATITATDGSSARAFAAPGQPVTGGRLSNLPPPAGIGVYDSVPTSSVNTYRDGDLQQIASWMIHLGTVDQQRFPGISIDLANTAYPYFAQTTAMDLGDRFVMVNPPPWLGADPVSQLCQGLKETLWSFDYLIEVNGVPETPYEVAQAGVAHAATAGSQLCSAATSMAAQLTVASAGAPWTASGSDVPFSVMVAGEEMTVTAVAAAASGSVTSPAAFTFIATCPIPAGTWTIGWTVTLSGTLSGSDANNFGLTLGSGPTIAAPSANAAAAGTYPQAPVTFTVTAADTLVVKSWSSAATGGAVYAASITSPQKLAVTRSANGVVKAQAAGAAVQVYTRPVAGL